MNSIDFEINNDYSKGIFVIKGRYCEFTTEVKRRFPKGKDICHGVSFHCMSNAIVNAMNCFWCKDANVEKTLDYIYGIIIATKRVKHIEPRNMMGISDYKEYIEKLEHVLNNILSVETIEERQFFCEHSVYYLNKILEKLYNEIENLHAGHSSWNRAIGGAYDPIGYSVTTNGFVLGEKDSIAITNLNRFTLGKDDDYPSENALFFYSCTIEGQIFLYTSCTERDFKKVTEISVCNNSIEYTDYLDGETKFLNILEE